MQIETTRLVLRALEERDNDMLLELINDPDTEFLLGGWSFPVSSHDQNRWYEGLQNSHDTLRCIVEKKEENTSIGTVMLTNIDYKNGTANIHIKLANETNRGKGYGSECVRALVAYAFAELRLNCIYAHIHALNEPSWRMFEKCGFIREGVLRSRLYKRGRFIDVYSYSILVSDQRNIGIND